jgi:hypothetical protein
VAWSIRETSLGPPTPASLAAFHAATNSAFREASLGGDAWANAGSDPSTTNNATTAEITFCTELSWNIAFDGSDDTNNCK